MVLQCCPGWPMQVFVLLPAREVGLQVLATLNCGASLPALLFRRIALMNQMMIVVEQILGAFLWIVRLIM